MADRTFSPEITSAPMEQKLKITPINQQSESKEVSKLSKHITRTAGNKALNIIGFILCLLMLPIVIVNMTLFIQSLIQPDVPPNFMGYTPLIVSSGSMTPSFDVTDMVIVKTPENAADLADGEVVCYLSGNSLTTHRIVGRETSDEGHMVYVTQGDANNAPDRVRVNPSQIIGVYKTHIPKLGKFALFMQTPTGIILFVVLPLLTMFIIFRIIDNRRYAALMKEKEAPLRTVETAPEH